MLSPFRWAACALHMAGSLLDRAFLVFDLLLWSAVACYRCSAWTACCPSTRTRASSLQPKRKQACALHIHLCDEPMATLWSAVACCRCSAGQLAVQQPVCPRASSLQPKRKQACALHIHLCDEPMATLWSAVACYRCSAGQLAVQHLNPYTREQACALHMIAQKSSSIETRSHLNESTVRRKPASASHRNQPIEHHR